jgi:hypothetical protein
MKNDNFKTHPECPFWCSQSLGVEIVFTMALSNSGGHFKQASGLSLISNSNNLSTLHSNSNCDPENINTFAFNFVKLSKYSVKHTSNQPINQLLNDCANVERNIYLIEL